MDMRKLPCVQLFDWHAGKDRSGFLTGYMENDGQALAVQQIIEYEHGNAAYVLHRTPRPTAITAKDIR
jgi:hypothetical protein